MHCLVAKNNFTPNTNCSSLSFSPLFAPSFLEEDRYVLQNQAPYYLAPAKLIPVLLEVPFHQNTAGNRWLSPIGAIPSYAFYSSGEFTGQDQTDFIDENYIFPFTANSDCESMNDYQGLLSDSLSVSGFVTDVSTIGGSDGAIDLFVLGGTPSYSFNWSNGATTEDISGLPAGTYVVTITDADNTTLIDSFDVIELIPAGNVTKTASLDSVLTGTSFTYTLTYGCAGTTGDCNDVVLTDTLPPYLEFISFQENINHSSNTYYDAVNRVVVFELDKETGNGLFSGSSGQVSIDVRFVNGTTPDSVIARNQAQIFSSNGSTGHSEIVTTEAIAEDKWTLDKSLSNATDIYLDVPITYELSIEDPTMGMEGGLNLLNATLVDTLPIGATFVSATNGGLFDATNNTVTWNLGDLLISSGSAQQQTLYLTVIYPAASFSTGEIITNVSCLLGDPIGEEVGQVVSKDSETTEIGLSNQSAFLSKNTEGTSVKSVGDNVSYGFLVENNGTTPLENFTLIDTIPPQVRVSTVKTGSYNTAPLNLVISYQTNLNATWTNWPGGPFDGTTDEGLHVSSLGLAAGEYVSMVRFEYGTVYPGFTNTGSYSDIDIIGWIISPDQNGDIVNPDDIINNCAYLHYDYAGSGTEISCDDFAIEPADVIVSKTFSNYFVNIGDTFSYNFLPDNNNAFAVDSFLLYDTIPDQMELTGVSTGIYNAVPPFSYSLEYKTNLSTTWTVWPGGPFATDVNANLATVDLSLGIGEYVTQVQWNFGTVPPWFIPTTNPELIGVLLTTDRLGNPVQGGDIIENCADLVARFDGSELTDQDCIDIQAVEVGPADLTVTKTTGNSTARIYSDFDYIIYGENTGGVDLDSFRLIDTIPPQMEFFKTETGAWLNMPSNGLNMRYQTNLNTSWRDWPGSPFDGINEEQLFPSDLPLVAGERVTILMWDFGTVPPGFTHDGSRPRVTGYMMPIDYNGDTVSVGDQVWNCAHLVGIHDTITLTDNECTYVIVEPVNPPAIEVYKTRSHETRRPGEDINYSIRYRNSGGTPLDSFIIIDTIPIEFDLIRIRAGTWSEEFATSLMMRYQTNLNNAWTDFPNAPFNGINVGDQEVSDLSLVPGEYITVVQWDFGNVPFGFRELSRSYLYGSLLSVDRNGDPVLGNQTVNNCAYICGVWDDTTYTDSECVDFFTDYPVLESDPTKQIVTSSGGYTFTDGPYAPGDTVEYRIRIENDGSSEVDMLDPIAMDLLSIKLAYIPGSWTIEENTAGAPIPDFESLDNFSGTGRTLLRWSWSGATSHAFPPSSYVRIRFKAVIAPNVFSGETIVNQLYQVSNQGGDLCDESSVVDVYDMDADGDFTDIICESNNDTEISIGTSVAISSEKLVKGQLDEEYSKYPDYGLTTPGGIADYQLFVRNTGTVAMDEIIVVDILPSVGDQGVINQLPRYSRWRPNLAGPVTAPPGVTVYYSTSGNPCRSTEGLVPSGPAGCETPGWSTAPPADINTVQSLKFDFGTIELEPGDEILLEWPMRAPVNALDGIGFQPDSIAWNSFGYIASRVDNGTTLVPSEPVKVGIKMQNLEPAVYGDFVWLDTNKDGIQDFGEPGIDGVRVELYEDNGDGIADPNTDTFVNWTLTANDGLYLFSDLDEGNYYALFYKPLAFEASPVDAGVDDAIDSDGVLGTYGGFPVAVAPVTFIDTINYDLDWDMGFYPSDSASIGNYIWNDVNGNGIQDEPLTEGVNGITVNLYDNSNPGVIYATTISQNDPFGNPGFYFFDAIPTQDYYVEFILSPFASFTTQGISGTADPDDSDVNPSTGLTEVFTSVAGVHDDSWDAGIILPTGNLSLGNQVWYETDNNGLYEPANGDVGINGVIVNLYIDTNGDGVFSPGLDDFFKTTTTYTDLGIPGRYLFTDLPAAEFIVQIDPINFLGGGALNNWVSTNGNGVAPDPDDNINDDDNGDPLTGYGVISQAISLTDGMEPVNDGDINTNSNLSLDFGFTDPCFLSIDQVLIASCNYDECQRDIAVELSWISPPAGELLILEVGDSATTIDPGILSSPQTITVTIPNDGSMTNDTIRFTSSLSFCYDTTIFTIPQDTEPPVFDEPLDVTINCHQDLSDLAILGNVANVSDNCGIMDTTYTDDYSGFSNCNGTITRTWSISDFCGNQTQHDQDITLIDSISPLFDISIPNDTLVLCDELIPDPIMPTASDNCDTLTVVDFKQTVIYHPSVDWNSGGGCDLIYSVDNIICNDAGTPLDDSDDTMTFDLVVIGRNNATGWNTIINASAYTGVYNQIYTLGPFSVGGVLSFVVFDDADGSCQISVNVDPANCNP